MNYFEWQKNKSSLIIDILENLDVEFNEELDFDSLNIAFTMMYGDRIISSKLKSLSTPEISKMLLSLYKDKWLSTYELVYNEIKNGVSSSSTLTDEFLKLEKSKSDRTNTDNVSAFNDDEYSPDTERKENNSTDVDGEENRTRTQEIRSLWAVQQQLRMSETGFIKDTVFKDIANTITLNIY